MPRAAAPSSATLALMDRRSGIALVADGLSLCTMAAADRDALIAIRSTPEVHRRWRGGDLGAEFEADLADDATERLTIRSDHDIVGLIQFAEEEDPEYRHASIDIYVDPARHRQGIATRAIAAVVDHLFGVRGHHRLTIDPAADNVAAIRCYEQVGFRRVGIMREYERQPDGTWSDGVLMEMLASDRPGLS